MIDPKKIAGEKAAEYVKSGMKVVLGTGSMASFMIHRLGQMVKEGLDIKCFPTSRESEELARSLQIPLLKENEVTRLDITIDGADEFDPAKNLIKGGGGALLREKMVAIITDHYVVVADESKQVEQLGAFTVPVEVVPFAWQLTARHIQDLDAETSIRESDKGFYRTDNNNYVLDSDFGAILDAAELERVLNQIPGVVANGLFVQIADEIICAGADGEVRVFT